MSSIMTNASAMTALQTLKQTNKQMEVTQNRISTGYRVAQASDNAAYWSIATTMRSDHSSMSTVQDSLGLGAATVDVAYTAMESANKYLNEIKSKLVAATATGVDKAKIQGEIKVLQESLTSLASSASFSGSNWMSVDSSPAGYNATQSIIGSFTREGSGAITLGKIDIDTSKIALFDSNAQGAGLLDAGLGNTSTASIAEGTAAGSAAVSAEAATAGSLVVTGVSIGTHAATDTVDITLNIDGTDVTETVAFGADADAFAANIAAAFSITVANDAGEFTFTSGTEGEDSIVSIVSAGNFADTDGDPVTGQLTGFAAAAGTAGTEEVEAADAAAATLTLTDAFSGPVTLDGDDTISFDIAVDGGTAVTVTINKATIDAALGSEDGAIADADDFATVLTQALSDAGVSGVTATNDSGNIVFTSGTEGAASAIEISNVEASNGGAAFGITDIDITNSSREEIEDYITGVNRMIENVTDAAATLGAVKKRVDMQKDFVSNLMDAIDRGVGQLVDANMEEESTRLQALQVQQQLGIQALSIANSGAQSILSLFR